MLNISVFLLQEIGIPGLMMLGHFRETWDKFGHFPSSVQTSQMTTWLIYCYLNHSSFFFFLTCKSVSICLLWKSPIPYNSMPIYPYIFVSKESSWLKIWPHRMPLETSKGLLSLLHRPFLICDHTQNASLTSFSQQLLVWWRRLTSHLSLVN